MINIIIYIVKILIIIFFTGYGFASLFLPEKLKRDSFFIIFWIGIIISVVFSVSLTIARIPISQGKYIILFFSFLFLIYSLIKKKTLITFSRETLAISIFALILLFINLYPSIAKIGPSTITKESEYLIDHSLMDDITTLPYKPHLEEAANFSNYGFKLGNSLFLGFISDTLGIRAYKIYYILVSILFSLTFPLAYILAKNFLKKENKYLLIITFLVFAGTSRFLLMFNNVSLAQFLFSGILVLILIFLQSYFSEKANMTYFFNLYDFLAAMAISSASSIYPEGLTAVYFFLALYFVLRIFIKKRTEIFWPLLKITVLAALINPISFGLAFKLC